MGLGLDNNLKIIFGLALDGYRSPKKCNRIGELVCGPATLLDVLEIRLGLRAKAVPFARRVAQYRTLLQQANFDQPRFYSASFERDPIASAEVLLRWRDDLVLAGWEGSVRTSDSQRLQDLAAVETLVAGVLSSGVGDRLNAIIREIENRDPHLSGIEVIDDAGHLPTLFRQLFERLGATFGSRSRTSLEPTAESGTDLRKIQEALLKPGGQIELRGDESVLFFTASSEVSLAQFAAQILANSRRQQRATSLVAESDCLHIDAALRALDEPILAMAPHSQLRPVLQLLALVLRLHWAPLDPTCLLEFLAHPVGPMKRRLRSRLASAVSEHPGIGGSRWQAAIADVKSSIEKKHSDDAHARSKALKQLDEEIATWINCQRFDRNYGAPGQAIAQTCSRLAQWAAGMANVAGSSAAMNTQYLALASQASELSEMVRAMERVKLPELDRILEHISGIGTRAIDEAAELGSAHRMNSPGAAFEVTDAVLWWSFRGPLAAPLVPWTVAEIEQLKQGGTEVLSCSAQLDYEHLISLRPIFAARRLIVFFIPRKEGNKPVPHHLLHDRMEALVGRNKLPVFDLDDYVGSRTAIWPNSCPIALADINHRPLTPLRRWWKLPDGSHLGPRDQESFSSATKFIFNPYQWVLEYKAKLRPGIMFGNQLVRESRQRGNLLHRLTELFFADDAPIDWRKAGHDEVAKWTETEWEQLLSLEGANLLLPGKRAVGDALLEEGKRALWCLVEHLREAGVTTVKVNHQPAAQPFVGGTIGGVIDLLADSGAGRAAVIDMKYRQHTAKRNELRKNLQLQLAIYGCLVASGGKWPEAAYFILSRECLLAQNRDYFRGAEEVPVGKAVDAGLEACWREFLDIWKWRRELLDQGWIEVTVEGTDPNEDTGPQSGARAVIERWQPKKGVDQYNDFDALTGFRENV